MRAEAGTADEDGADLAMPLGAWLSVFAPVYLGKMAALVGLNILVAVSTFVELQVLRALTVVFGRAPDAAGASCSLGQWVESGFSLAASPCGARLPLFLLLTYTATIFAQSGVDIAAYAVNSRLSQQGRHDVERELLRNLLQQDDSFFLRRPPSEVMSRLSGDLQRVAGRRQIVTQAIASGLSIIATFCVLVMQSWPAAVIGLGISAIGVLAAQPLLRKLRELDRASIASDEQVKAAFEDTLQGVAEIQVSGLLRRVLTRFERRQAGRDVVSVRNADLNNMNAVYQRMTFTLGFIAILAMFVLTDIFRVAGAPAAASDAGGGAAGLIVVLIASLPQLYFKFGELSQLYTQFRIADEARLRLMQYEAPRAPVQPTSAPSTDAAQVGAIVMRGVRYQFAGAEAIQGGADGINCLIPARGLTGVVGPAGSGKSTLIRLILGRQKFIDGVIARPEPPATGSLFVYLPQRPVLFDAPLRDNLFLSSQRPEPLALAALGGRLGILDLVRTKGLDATPGETAAEGADIASLRAGFRQAVEASLNVQLSPLGPGRPSPRQMVIESQLGCAADQSVIAQRLISPEGRAPVRALAHLPYARDVAPLALALIRQTGPLLGRAGNADEYNRAAAFKIDPAIFMLRASSVEMVLGLADLPPAGSHLALLVAIALSVRIEELDNAPPPAPSAEAMAHLRTLAADVSRPLAADRVNSMLPWRENLLFAAPDPANTRRLAQVDAVLLGHLQNTPLDNAVIEAGLDYPIGRQGGRLSGGQQQLVALGRALLTPGPFLVLDEPSSAFHPKLRQEAIAVIKEEGKSRSVVVVTHDMDMARACDRILFVRDGALAGQGSWDSLVAHTEGFAAWIAESGAAA